MGAGLLANAVCQPTKRLLIHRIREQARSHTLIDVQSVGFALRALKNSLNTVPHSCASTPPSNSTR